MAKPFEALRVGDEATLTIEVTREDTGAAWNPISATVLIFDPDRITEGTADSGSATTLVDDARTEADDFWNGLSIVIEDADDGQEYRTEITDFAAANDTLTFGKLPITVAAGDTYTIEGYPLVPQTAAGVSANEVSYQVTPANGVTARPGRRVIVFHLDFGTDSFDDIWDLEVLPSL